MSDDEKKLFDEIVLKLLTHAGGEPVEKTAMRIIEVRRARIAELEKELARVRATEQERRRLEIESHKGIVADLEKRLAEATAVPTVDGKTPGEVAYEAWRGLPSSKEYARTSGAGFGAVSKPERGEWEAIAQAVLRAFGGEALRKVRERIAGGSYQPSDDDDGEVVDLEYATQVIDSEIANIGAAITDTSKPTKPAAIESAPPGLTGPKKPTKPSEES